MTQLDDASILQEPHGTEELVEEREEVKEVLEGVSKLPDDRREALIMRFALGMDNREIARALVVCMELQADAGSYRDVAERIDRLTKVQAGS